MADNSTLDEFVISVKLKTDKLDQDFSKLSGSFDKLSKNIKDKFDKAFDPNTLKKNLDKNIDTIKLATINISKILTGGLATLGGFLGTKFAIDFVKNATANANHTQLLSKAFNVRPQQLQLLQEVYKRAGGSAGDASQVVAQLYQRLTSGQPDVGIASAFHQLGIKVTPGHINPVQLITQALQSLSSGKFNEVQRGSIVNRLGLGTEGLALANSPGDLQKYISEAQKDLVSDKSINQLADLDRKFQDLGERWNKIQNVLLTKIEPALETFTGWVEKILNIQPANIAKDGVNAIKNNGLLSKYTTNADKTISDWTSSNIKAQKGKGFLNDLGDAWNYVKNSISKVETSGGLPKQIAKAESLGAYGTYGLRLSTAKDQLRYEKKFKEADSLTANDLTANNNQLANKLAGDYFNRLNKSYGTENAIKRYHGSTNKAENQEYLNKVIGHQIQPLQPQVQSNAVATHHNTSYNIGDLHMHGVNDRKSLIDELHSSTNTAFSFAGNVSA